MECSEEIDGPFKAFQACLQAFMVSVNQRIDNFIVDVNTKVTELKVSLEYTQADIESFKQSVTKNENADDHIAKIEETLSKHADSIDYLENQSRRCNVRIDGLQESGNETWEETEVQFRQMLTEKLDIPSETAAAIDIERAHRTGPQHKPNADSKRPRQIVAKLTHFKDREMILKKAREVKPSNLFINEDFSQRVVDKRKQLLPKMQQLRREGKIAYLSFDKLIVKDKHQK